MDLSFKKEFLDTGIVTSVQTWCFGKEPVVSPLQVAYAAGANKFSICAGYTFTCTKAKDYNTLKIVYCPKLHSKIFNRDPSNRSRWFMWQQIGKSGCIVINSDKCEEIFGFDVYKFIKTAEFKKGQRFFARNIQRGISEAKKLRNSVDPENRNQFDTYVKSLEEAVKIITEIPNIEESEYKLIDFDKFRKEIVDRGYGGELRDRASKMNDYNRSVGTKFIDKVKHNELKDGEQDKAVRAQKFADKMNGEIEKARALFGVEP